MAALLKACAAAGMLLSLGACRTSRGRPADADVPAVIVNPTAESRTALVQAVSTALNGAQVTLALDALTDASTLIIERTRRRDPSGLPIDGRDLGYPERFRLVKRAGKCILVHEGSGRRFILAATSCIASTPKSVPQ
jgi:hypothetical protein